MCHFQGEFEEGKFSRKGYSCEHLATAIDSIWDGCAQSQASWRVPVVSMSVLIPFTFTQLLDARRVNNLQGLFVDITFGA